GCTQHGYAWNFGDGGSSTDAAPSHIYNSNGIYTATLTLNNGSQTATVPVTVKVGNVTTTQCPALTAQNLAPAFSSPNANCHAGGSCTASEAINFHVDVTNYQTGCGI